MNKHSKTNTNQTHKCPNKNCKFCKQQQKSSLPKPKQNQPNNTQTQSSSQKPKQVLPNIINLFSTQTTEELVLNVYINSKFAFQQSVSTSFTLSNLKNYILLKTKIESMNYTVWFNNHDISKCDSFTFNEIILLKNKPSYDIHIKLNNTLIEIDLSPVIMTYKEGDRYIIAYKTKSRKFEKKYPRYFEGKTFNYNSRSCHITNPYEKKLIIVGGTNSKDIVLYDYDNNDIDCFPQMKHERQRHSVICVGKGRIFIIGGDNSNKVTSVYINGQLYQEHPDMHFKRKDASLCFINNKWLYVFMGYGDDEMKLLNNYERIDVTLDAFDTKWELLPFNGDVDLNLPRCYCGMFYNNKTFYVFGGVVNANVMGDVLEGNESEEEGMIAKGSGIKLGENCGFEENMFVENEETFGKEWYLFAMGFKVVCYNSTYNTVEIIRSPFH